MSNVAVINKEKSLVASFAGKYSVEPEKLLQTLKSTAFKQQGNKVVSNEQMMSLLVVANEYNLNPFTREIYAFPSNGGVTPIVPVDGWMKIINSHPDFDGMQFKDHIDEKGSITAITCSMYRKDRSHPVEVTEYMSECSRNTDPWKKWPARMLRHKAAIQAARYAFSFSGIYDPDEGERIQESEVKDVDQGPTYNDEQKAEFDSLMDSSNAIGLYVFREGFGDPDSPGWAVWSSLSNSFKHGEKTAKGILMRKLVNDGEAQFIELMESIAEMARNDDDLGIKQEWEDLSQPVQTLIMERIDNEVRHVLVGEMGL